MRTVAVFMLPKAVDSVRATVEVAITELGTIAERIATPVDRTLEANRVIGDSRHFPDGRWQRINPHRHHHARPLPDGLLASLTGGVLTRLNSAST